jgi:16S rRNA (adenine1518-N6/adenine1519-N6)-dimethyltransferase
MMNENMKKRSPKRRGAKLGQHLLTNQSVARAVGEAAGIVKGDTVLEIGPGKGMLTRELLALGARVIAIEKDPAMVEAMRDNFKAEIGSGALTLIEGDIRDVSTDFLEKKRVYKVAANIPYYITGELIRMFLSAKHQPQSLAFLVQKEVAERVARAKKESILSLSVKAYGAPKYVRTVAKGNFNPPPSVDSAILAVRDISRKNFKAISEDMFFKTVKAGFAQKRKTLGGNLKKAFGERALDALTACSIGPNARAEDVSLEKWLTLSKALQ